MDDSPAPPAPDADPAFGPSGYLPDRAARRARKIILRAPLGLHWIVAAAGFGLLVLVAGLVFLRSGGPPEAPYVAVGSLGQARALAVPEVDALLVADAGPVLAFADLEAAGLAYCEPTRRIEAADGRVWTASGRGLGTASLQRLPVVVHDGVVHVDPTTRLPGPAPSDVRESPTCR